MAEGRLVKVHSQNMSHVEMVGRFFYIMDPHKHMFETPIEVPDYLIEALPFFVAAVFLEMFIAFLQDGYNHKLFYVFNNISAAMFQVTINKLVVQPLGYVLYCYVHQHYRLTTLPWDSVWTWLFAFVAIDFAYYWFHRMAHEVNLLWCAHQMHHSSEDYNLTTAFRQSIAQKYFKLVYIPIALILPPSIYLVHAQFNLLYQVWIHTEVVPKLGPLEYIFNTASHHRVHHGRNIYCIDTNYGGTLIIWDRILGTFAEEEEKVSYGLVYPEYTANPLLLQGGHFYYLYRRFCKLEKWSDKLNCLFRKPCWMAESEKVGLTPEQMEIPEVESPVQLRVLEHFKMEDRLETYYVLFHFLISTFVFVTFFGNYMSLSVITAYGCMCYLFLTLTSCGFILEGRWFWCHVEVIRCLSVFAIDAYLTWKSIDNPVFRMKYVLYGVRIIHCLSLLITSFQILTKIDDVASKKKKK
ncbi:alkylglycerol monooxygenase-like [Clytia hemisphaerica]|uniref:Alkylglycerol monooxygenase n=1 Tax=Clytia hemisphaerica TaxID=252671 RepID=A0A7M5XAG6_9CNID|eukprot:TCONS_00066776-protein